MSVFDTSLLSLGEMFRYADIHRERVSDTIRHHMPVYDKIVGRGNERAVTGPGIGQPIMAHENPNAIWLKGKSSPFSTVSHNPYEIAEFGQKTLTVSVAIEDDEKSKLTGRTAAINYIAGKLENMDRTIANEMGRAIFSAGTDGRLTGLRSIVSTTGGGVYGKIDASLARNSWWKNQTKDVQANPSATQLQKAIRELFTKQTINNDRPDLIVMDGEMFNVFEDILTDKDRYPMHGTSSPAAVDHVMVKYKGAMVVHDDFAPADQVYILNCGYLHWRVWEGYNYKRSRPLMLPNQHVAIINVSWRGNMTCSNRHMQGVVH